TAPQCARFNLLFGSISNPALKHIFARESFKTPSFLCFNFLVLLVGPTQPAERCLGMNWSKAAQFLLLLFVAEGCCAQDSGNSSRASSNSPAASSGSDPQAVLSSARVLLGQGKFDEAIPQLLSLTATSPAVKGISRELGLA